LQRVEDRRVAKELRHLAQVQLRAVLETGEEVLQGHSLVAGFLLQQQEDLLPRVRVESFGRSFQVVHFSFIKSFPFLFEMIFFLFSSP